jgi:hypothetical protein
VAAVAAVAVTRTRLATRAAAVVAVVQESRLSSTQRQTFLQPLRWQSARLERAARA